MMLTTSLSTQSVDESIIREQVLSTHNPDGREFDTNFILSMAEKTINLETGTAHQKVMVEELNQLEELDTYKELLLHIRQLSFEDDASWSTEYEQQCDKLRNKMRFRWLNEPKKMLRPQFTRFVKEELFQKRWGEEPIIVSLDQRGKIVHPNAIHMMLTWTPYDIEQNTIGVKVIPHNITLFIQNELKQGIYGIEASSESSNFRHNVGPKIDSMTTDLVHNIADKINAWKYDVERIIEEMTAQSTPYDSEKEKLLWQQQTWTLHLLAPQSDYRYRYYYTIGMPINDWIREEKYIFLYGGNNIKWIREFLCKVREVASKTQMNFEFAYIGKNKMVRETIAKERMSHCALLNSNGVWWFWARLRSMFLSRIQYLEMANHFGKEYNNDEILQGLKKILSYEGKNATTEGWVLLSKGSEVVVCGHGSKMLQAMNDYEIWKENIAATKGFDQAFKDYHEMLSKDKHSCCTLEYPITLSKIPENERCPECSRRVKVIPHNITLFIQNELKQGIYGIEASSESSNFRHNVGPKIDSMTTDLVHNIADKINAWKKDVEAIIEEMTAKSTPYDSEKEKLLWQQQTWTLHLLAPQSGNHYYTIGMPITDWIGKEKYIFLYGGNNIKWIREFICKAREVASKTQMNFEFAYIGKNKIIRETIDKERMSHCALLNSNGVWWFWARLRSKNATTEGWVLLSKGSEVVVCGHGSKMLQAMNDYEIWKENIAATKGFDQAFKDYHEMLSKDKHSCCTLEYPITLSKIPENERCPECSRRMQKFLTFSCCHDHHHDVDYDSDE
nr:uncharacterized protein LOC109153404 isoform X2 [Ipomoea trifida]